MARATFVLAIAAVVAAATAAVLPREPGAARPTRHLFRTFFIESHTLPGAPPGPINGLFAQAVHSGAGLNNIQMVPIDDATEFHYNKTSRQIHHDEGTAPYRYPYTFLLANERTDTKRLAQSYNNIQFNAGSDPHATTFYIDQGVRQITPRPPPKGFLDFAVCHTDVIADDEPRSSYLQLVWQHGPTSAEGCVPVFLTMTNVYGG